jgi:hypothetical protein
LRLLLTGFQTLTGILNPVRGNKVFKDFKDFKVLKVEVGAFPFGLSSLVGGILAAINKR